eukprot:c19026_g1_i1.p1 GENE.c19026_g1_i1~~c19026_g1_i1.p1  ORF type:complete len:600 (+),score=131.83 c19026_g1_i1:42-1841(+)
MEVVCTVCENELNDTDRCPRVLHCGHWFCTSCLQVICDASTKAIICPEDKQITQLPGNGVFALPKLPSFSQLKNEDSHQTCEFCDDSHPATHWCHDCAQRMCEPQIASHKKIRATCKHHITSLESQSKVQPSGTCAQHSGAQFILFDMDCDKPLCDQCVELEAHAKHKLVSLQKVAGQCVEGLHTLAGEGETALQTLEQVGALLAQLKQEISENSAKARAEVRARIAEFSSVLIERENALLTAVDQMEKRKLFSIDDQQKRVQNLVATVKHANEFCTELSKLVSPVSIVSAFTDAQAGIQHALQASEAFRISESSRIDFVLTDGSMRFVNETILDIGRIQGDERSIANNTEATKPQPAAPAVDSKTRDFQNAILNHLRSHDSDRSIENQIANLFATEPSITCLDLGHSELDDSHAKIIAMVLAKNQTLTRLSLNGNKIKTKGAKSLAFGLRSNTTLRELFLAGNQIQNQGAKALANSLRENSTLTRLSLADNRVSDDGAKALAAALRKNSTLLELSLSNHRHAPGPGNMVGRSGANEFAEVLKQNNTLTKLLMAGNPIGDKGAKALLGALEVNQTLSSLALVEISVEILREIDRAIRSR